MAQGGQVLRREKALVCQGAVQTGGAMALRQNKAVTIRPLGVLGIHTHFFAIQICEHIRGGQTAAGVPGFGAVGAVYNAQTDLGGVDLERLFGCLVHNDNSFKKISSVF